MSINRYSFLIILVSLFAHTNTAKADSIDFVASLLSDILEEKHNFPTWEANKFSECVTNYIRPRINSQQKKALDSAQWDYEESKNFSIATEVALEKSNFPLLGASAQEYCTNLIYPGSQ